MIGSKNVMSPVRSSRPRAERASSEGDGPTTIERKYRTGATKPKPSSCPAKMKMVGLCPHDVC